MPLTLIARADSTGQFPLADSLGRAQLSLDRIIPALGTLCRSRTLGEAARVRHQRCAR
jgi:hypothetical protein